MDSVQTAAECGVSRSLPSLGTDLWVTILAKTEVEHVLSFAKVSRATSELVGNDVLWRGIWFARYHREFYCENDFVKDSLNDRGLLSSNIFEVHVPSQQTRADPSVSPWASWRDKVLWRAALARCGSDSEKTGCNRLFSGREASLASNSPILCPSCVQASSLVVLLQDMQLADPRNESDDSQRGGEV